MRKFFVGQEGRFPIFLNLVYPRSDSYFYGIFKLEINNIRN